MSLTDLWQAARAQWHDLTQRLWPDSPEERTCAEIERLTADLSRRYQRLVRLRCRIERLRDRLAHQPRGAGRLARLEERYQAACRQLDRRKRLREALLRGQVQVADPGAADSHLS
jgi:hypothetical protein